MSTPLPVPDDQERAMNASSNKRGGPPPQIQKERQEQSTTVIQMTIQPQSTGTADTPAATLAATDFTTAFPQALIDTALPMEITAEGAEEAPGARAAALECVAQQPESEPVLGTEPGVRQWTELGAEQGAELGAELCAEQGAELGAELCEEQGAALGAELCAELGAELGADSSRPRPAFSYRNEPVQLQPSTSTAHSTDTYEYSDEGEFALERALAAIGQPAEEPEQPVVEPPVAEPPVLDSVSMFHELELGFNLRRFEEGAQLPSDPPSVEYSDNGATVQSELFELGQRGMALQELPPAVDATVEEPPTATAALAMRAASALPIAEQPGPSRPRAHAVQLYPGGGDGEPQTCYLTHLPRLDFEPTFLDEAPMRADPVPPQEHPVPLASADVLANLMGVPTDDEADMSPSYLNTPEDSMGVDKENQPDTVAEALRSAAAAFAEFSTDDSQTADGAVATVQDPELTAAASDAAEVDARQPVGMKPEHTAAASDAAEVDAQEPVGMKPEDTAAASDAAEVNAHEPVGMKPEDTAAASDAAEVDAQEPVGMKPEDTDAASDAVEVDAQEPVGMKPEHTTAASDAAEIDAHEPVGMKPEHSARGGTPAVGEESGQIDAATKVEAEVTMEESLSDDEPLSNLLITGVATAEPFTSKKSSKKLKRKRNATNKTEHAHKRTASQSQSAADEPTITGQNIQLQAEAAIAPQNIPPAAVAATTAEAIEPQQSGSKKPKRKRSLPTLAPKTKQSKKILPPEISTTTMVLRSKSHHS